MVIYFYRKLYPIAILAGIWFTYYSKNVDFGFFFKSVESPKTHKRIWESAEALVTSFNHSLVFCDSPFDYSYYRI